MDTTINLYAAWIGIALGMLLGATLGLFFSRADFLGGYTTFPRRLVRLGHISFFGLAFLNLAFVYTVEQIEESARALSPWIDYASPALVAGAVLMPTVCFLAAWRKPLRHLFALPVGCLLAAVLCLLVGGIPS